MARLESASTIYVQAYLTSKGREYFSGFNLDGENARFDGDIDLFQAKTFSLYDTDVNYKTTQPLESGDVPDISGSDGCLMTSAYQLRKHFLTNGVNVEEIPFDFAVIRYSWEAVGYQTDVDTRTAILGTGSDAVDMVDVGYDRGTQVNMTYPNPVGGVERYVGPSEDEYYLKWGRDNASASVGGKYTESVLVDFNRLIEDFGTVEEFQVRLRSYWVSSIAISGPLTVELTTYTGGEMVYDSYTFNYFNEGGVESFTTSFDTVLNHYVVNGNENGSDVGLISFNAATRTASLIKVE